MGVLHRLSGLCFTLSCPGSAQWGKTGSFSPAWYSVHNAAPNFSPYHTDPAATKVPALWLLPLSLVPPSPSIHQPRMCSFSCVLNIISTLVERHSVWKHDENHYSKWKPAAQKPHKVPLTVLASDFPVFYICVLFSPWLSVTAPRLTIWGSSPVKKCCTEELHFLMNDKLQFWDAWPQTHKVWHPEQSIPLDTIACWDMSSDFPS